MEKVKYSSLLERIDRWNLNLPETEVIVVSHDEVFELASALANGGLKSVKGRYLHVDQVLKGLIEGTMRIGGHKVQIL